MDEIIALLEDAKKVARQYKKLTGKPLGITGEVAEVTAAQLLNLNLSDARQAGYDAIKRENGKDVKIQIKGRSLPKKANPGARIGKIQLDKEWDVVMLVLLDDEFEPIEIFEANRDVISKALLAPGSKARNERGALGIAKFKSIGRKVWPY